MRETLTATKVRTAALKEKRESSRRAETRVEELVRALQGRIAGCVAELEKGDNESAGITGSDCAERRGIEISHVAAD